MQNAYVRGFEKRGHFAPAIFGRTHVFKWLLLGQTLLKLDENFCVKYLIILLALYENLEP